MISKETEFRMQKMRERISELESRMSISLQRCIEQGDRIAELEALLQRWGRWADVIDASPQQLFDDTVAALSKEYPAADVCSM